jgi:hypothetical protein
MWGACSSNILNMSYLYTLEIPKYEHVCAETLHQANKIKVIPNATQNSIAKMYGVDPFLLTDVEAVCDAKYVYAYILMSCTDLSIYDCGDEAGVIYGPLMRNKIVLDIERQHGTTFGRQLDVIVSNHKKTSYHV